MVLSDWGDGITLSPDEPPLCVMVFLIPASQEPKEPALNSPNIYYM